MNINSKLKRNNKKAIYKNLNIYFYLPISKIIKYLVKKINIDSDHSL